jgi:tetratricopeptide (TPR) repeat protein
LLSGRTIDRAGGYTDLAPDALRGLLNAQRASAPGDFSVSPSQASAWHRQKLARAEHFTPSAQIKIPARGSYFVGTWDLVDSAPRLRAVAFHLEQLQALHPEDPSWSQRRLVAQAEADRLMQRYSAGDPEGGETRSTRQTAASAQTPTGPSTLSLDEADLLQKLRTNVRTHLSANEPAAAVELLNKLLGEYRGETVESPGWCEVMALLGESLLAQREFSAAEPILRRCLPGFESRQPGLSPTLAVQGLLGLSLFGQKRYAEAATLLEKSYGGLEERQKDRPSESRVQLLKTTAERLAELYQAWGQPEQAAKWKQKTR